MDWRFTSNVFLILVATALVTRLAYYAWKRRPATGSTLFTLLMLAMAQWSLAYTLEITSTNLAAKLIWAKIQFLGVAILPVAWLIFVLEYSGKESRITRRNLVLLILIPLSTFLLAITNEAHGWIWRQTTLDLSSNAFPELQVEYGFWFWIHTSFSYLCLTVAAFILLSSWRREVAALYRWQTVALLFGLILPWVGNVLFVSGASPRELATFTYLISAGALVHFTLRFRLFDIAPVAHRAIFNSMSDAIVVLDAKNRIADVNPQAERIMERSATELIGETINEVWPDLYNRLQKGEEPIELTLGSPECPEHYEVAISPLEDWRNTSRGRLVVLHDITRQKEMERKREDMTHIMVHDLRDPLSNSLFALEMLKGDLYDYNSPESGQLLDVTFGQTMKTLKLVDEILEISRLKHGIEMIVTRNAFSVAEVIEKAISAQIPRALERRIQLQYDVPEDTPLVWADMGLIERVFQNLIDNSMKFSPPGGTIRIAVEEIEGTSRTGETRLHVSISDEGPGIPIELQEQIFEKFVTASVKGSGTGLGLAYCKMAMSALDEEIWVESEPGHGSRFVFTLPVAFEPALVRERA